MGKPDTGEIARKHLERSLVLIKPDGVRRGLTGEILRRLERPGLKIIAMKLIHVDRAFAERHYTYEDIAVRHGEQIRNQLLDYITEGPVVAAVFEGIAAVGTIRKICGSTEPAAAPPGTIRADFCHHGYAFCNDTRQAVRNVVHSSASLEEARTEIALWFDEGEMCTYRRCDAAEHIGD